MEQLVEIASARKCVDEHKPANLPKARTKAGVAAKVVLPSTETFSYTGLAADKVEALQKQAARIRAQVRRTTAALIEIGRDLIAFRQSLEHGQFCKWVVAELGLTVRSAQNYIQLATFAEHKSEFVSHLRPTSAYKLAAKSVPPELIVEIEDRLAAGEIISDDAVEGALADVRHQKREAQRRQQEAERLARRPRRTRERREQERRELEARQCAEDDACVQAAEAIWNTLGVDHVRYLLKQMEGNGGLRRWRIVDLLLKTATQNGTGSLDHEEQRRLAK